MTIETNLARIADALESIAARYAGAPLEPVEAPPPTTGKVTHTSAPVQLAATAPDAAPTQDTTGGVQHIPVPVSDKAVAAAAAPEPAQETDKKAAQDALMALAGAKGRDAVFALLRALSGNDQARTLGDVPPELWGDLVRKAAAGAAA